MEYTLLGKSNLNVSKLGFGCMSLNYNDQNSAFSIISKAIDNGINLFDTADLYDHGENEVLLGKAVKTKRHDIIIATKVGNQWRPDNQSWDWNPTKKYILASVEDSLRRLNTDYIDLYQLHGGTIADPIDETISAFEQLKREGKIRYYGISSIRPNVINEYIKKSHIVSVMMQYSLLDRRPEEACLSQLLEHNIGVLVRGGLAKGLLVNKPPVNYLNYTAEQVKDAADAVARNSGASRAVTQTALEFVFQHPAVSSAIVGIRTIEQLDEALKTIHSPKLNTEEMQQLRSAIPINKYEEHRI
ncbi:aldo/keto reductase [Chitinophaga silvatica]|uniref:Aldo/keto reductase n=1 Tax=Chitinophaga silvatica TaxID=2282649 RepID=A0A3E1Y846_9BACT|nr:aldo/keto reductase [Chitinophaga silvatica]RFS21345.1 aldo/keto reductase [Chitinophaga silvatica]